ncbi:MAG: hydrogen gas-evolving membrane-bound hydrogenase subunit E [Verrucomicrobiota bacterium]
MKWLALIAVILTGSLLIYGMSDFPAWGDPYSPANAGVEGGQESISQVFIEKTYPMTHVPNMVTAVLADYRGYDTMFETVVIFAAGIAIFAILRVLGDQKDKTPRPELDTSVNGDHQRIIIGTTCRLLIPVIQLFALYVVAHGHYSPGGGFQGGVILGASFILVGLSENLNAALRRFSEKNFMAMASIGILIYAGFGLVAQFFSRNFLDYGVLQKVLFTPDEGWARYHSMLGVEVGVTFTVTAIMFAIYANLSSKGELENGL